MAESGEMKSARRCELLERFFVFDLKDIWAVFTMYRRIGRI